MALRDDVDKLIAEMDRALQMPGVSNAWTMPIKNRIDMLATGIRTPIGVKVFGKDLEEIEILARQIETTVKTVPGTTSVYAERITGGYYLDIEPDRMALGAAAVVGSIPAGSFPREMRVTADGKTLILTNFGSRSIQMIDLARIP